MTAFGKCKAPFRYEAVKVTGKNTVIIRELN